MSGASAGSHQFLQAKQDLKLFNDASMSYLLGPAETGPQFLRASLGADS